MDGLPENEVKTPLEEAFMLGWISGSVIHYKHNPRGIDFQEALRRFRKNKGMTMKYSVVELSAGIGQKGMVFVECMNPYMEKILPKELKSGLVVVRLEDIQSILDKVNPAYELVTMSERKDENFHHVTLIFKS